MYFRLKFEAENGCFDLPLSYHHVLQGFIYHLLEENPDYAKFLHDTGFQVGQKAYKLFVFSLLAGRFTVSDGRIRFFDTVSLEIRSPMAEFNQLLSDIFSRQNLFVLDKNQIALKSIEIGDKTFFSDNAHIRFLSPLVLSQTVIDKGKKETRYLSPQDTDFYKMLNDNYRSKYKAAFGDWPSTDIHIDSGSWKQKKKYVTRFNDTIYITGWLGECNLTADSEAISFLYDVGLGSRNSQGFGMFEVNEYNS